MFSVSGFGCGGSRVEGLELGFGVVGGAGGGVGGVGAEWFRASTARRKTKPACPWWSSRVRRPCF